MLAPPPPPARPPSGNFAADLCLLVFGGLGAVVATAAAVTDGSSAWREPVVWACVLGGLAAALLALRFVLERRAGLRVGVDERFRWIDEPTGEAMHEAVVARRLPAGGRILRPLAYALVGAAWLLLLLG